MNLIFHNGQKLMLMIKWKTNLFDHLEYIFSELLILQVVGSVEFVDTNSFQFVLCWWTHGLVLVLIFLFVCSCCVLVGERSFGIWIFNTRQKIVWIYNDAGVFISEQEEKCGKCMVPTRRSTQVPTTITTSPSKKNTQHICSLCTFDFAFSVGASNHRPSQLHILSRPPPRSHPFFFPEVQFEPSTTPRQEEEKEEDR